MEGGNMEGGNMEGGNMEGGNMEGGNMEVGWASPTTTSIPVAKMNYKNVCYK